MCSDDHFSQSLVPAASQAGDGPEHPEPVLLVLLEISGYTRYMTANAKTLAHSQTAITELITALVRHVQLPLDVAKLEGDAVFLYCRKQRLPVPWQKIRGQISTRLIEFLAAFREKAAELAGSITCSCQACRHIDRLQLKIIVHAGEALFHQVLHFPELAGVNVIILHRLLKNSVPGSQYLLLTEPACKDLDSSPEVKLRESGEEYEALGRIRTFVWDRAGATTHACDAESPGFVDRFRNTRQMSWKWWFRALRRPRQAEARRYRNIIPGASTLNRNLFAVVTFLLPPFMLPVALVTALIHAARPQNTGSGTPSPATHRL